MLRFTVEQSEINLLSTVKSDPQSSYRVKHHDFSKPRSGRSGRVFLGDEVRRLEPISPNPWQRLLVVALLFTLLSSIVLELQLSLVIFYGLAFVGTICFFRESVSPRFTESEQTGFLILIVFFLISLLTYWINGMPGRGGALVEGRHAKLLLVIPVYIFFRNFSLSTMTLWLLAASVSLLLFFVALFDLNTSDGFGWPGRASGAAKPIEFAILSVTMSSLIIAFRDTWAEKRWPRNIARLGLIVGLLALFLSYSYSIWPAFVLIAIMYVVSRIERFRIRHVLQMSLVLCCIGLVLYQLPGVYNGLDRITTDYSAYKQSQSLTDASHSTDIGMMLENWRAAIAMIMESPLLGVGPGGYEAMASHFVEKGGWATSIAKFDGPGNLYLSAFATRGIFGLIITALLMVAPLLYCYRLRRRVDDEEVRQYAFAVILIVSVFLVAGVSIDVLETKALLIVYCTIIAILIGQIRQRVEH